MNANALKTVGATGMLIGALVLGATVPLRRKENKDNGTSGGDGTVYDAEDDDGNDNQAENVTGGFPEDRDPGKLGSLWLHKPIISDYY